SRLPGLPLVRQADRAAGVLRHPAALPRAHRGARGSAGGGPQPNCAFSRSAPRQPEIPHGAEAAAYRIARPGDGENHYPDHQPLSPRRHDFGRRVPRTLANRGVLPGAEAEPAAQVVCGHQPKRGSDPDLDSTDRHPVAQVFTAAFPVPVVAFQPGGAAASTTVCLPRPLDVDRRSVPAATRVAARTSATELTVHLSRAASQLGQPNANLIQKSPKMASKWRAINAARGKVCLIWTALCFSLPVFGVGRAPPRTLATIESSTRMSEDSIRELVASSLERIRAARNSEELEAVRVEALGRKGAISLASKEMGKLAPEAKAAFGKLLNGAKQTLEQAHKERQRSIDEDALARRLDGEWLDLTLPAPGPRRGHLHPITRIQRELEDLFRSLGFAVLDGPEVETEYHNFDALNIPATHPARDMQDTFWLDGGNLLRTHTSPVQVRGMERLGPPLRMIAPGRVFRNESVDASHEHTFYQLEGMMIDRDVSVAHLLYFMNTLLT